ncbi:DNA-3-methyladenine glycosylase [Delphinella strobiligena]|nr:DNA-3-methyladenine glycosylase [Delphinella strobiligena]
MSLRRSARVQALEPLPQAFNNNSLKRVFVTTKSASKGKPSKDISKPATGTIFPTPPSEAETPRKRQKLDYEAAATVAAIVSPAPLPAGYSTGDIDDAIPSSKDVRPAEPHTTNAPLESPKDGHIVTAYSNFESGLPAAEAVPPAPTSTTSTLLDEAISHLLKADTTSRLAPVIEKHHCHVFSPAGLAEIVDPFRSLSSGIMAQQVSGAAASSIKNKFINLFPADPAHSHPGPPEFPTPAMVAQTPLPTLRTAGLSQRKAEYIQGLAEKFVSGELTAEMLAKATDEEVMEKLVSVRGLGKWSVEMFACFGLKRMDVFSTGDLGVQRGMAAFVGRDVSKLKAKGGGKWKYMSEKDMLDISAKFSPYRSLFMWYMWRIEDVNVDAVQNV